MQKLCIAVLMISASISAVAQNAAQVALEGLNGKTAVLTVADMKQMPRQSITITDPKTAAKQFYEGVLLSAVLAKVDAPSGNKLHGKEFLDYVEVAASDNYRVIFSLAELDQPTHPNQVLLADTVDGKALEGQDGSFKLICPDDKRPERWVRMVTKIRIAKVQ